MLLNLIKLKKDLSPKLTSEEKYILTERCLFIKFLEDRGFLKPKTLIDIFSRGNGIILVKKFREINRLLNGDVFVKRYLRIKTLLKVSLISYLFFLHRITEISYCYSLINSKSYRSNY